MSTAPSLENVEYDTHAPVMDREQIDMLIMSDAGDADTSLAKELFELFASESSGKLDGLAEICASGDLRAFRDVIHFVAGSAGNLGLARLAAFYRGIECAVDEGCLKDITGVEDVVRGEFEIALEAFKADFEF